jgi:high-affinity Fe2+/Pb2+ permease
MLIASLLLLLGAVCIYLSSPHQRWLRKPLRASIARGCGVLLLILAQLCFWLVMRSVAAFFMFVSMAMVLFLVLPYLGAWWQLLRSGKPHG